MPYGPLKARQFKFDFRQCKTKYWFDNNPLKTIYGNTITSCIPFGERFISLLARSIYKDIKDKGMRKTLKEFILQEDNHSREHFRMYHQLVKPYYPKMLLNKSWAFKVLQAALFAAPKKMRFAGLAAAEHFTAATGEMYLRHPELLQGVDPRIKLLWEWHFVEEIEHRAVSYDLLKEVNCGYLMRIGGFIFATIFLIGCFMGPFFHMVRKEKLHTKMSFYCDLYRFLWSQEGVFKKVIKLYLRYLKPYYHPDQYAEPSLVEQWAAQRDYIEKKIELEYSES